MARTGASFCESRVARDQRAYATHSFNSADGLATLDSAGVVRALFDAGLDVPVAAWDERLTTDAARQLAEEHLAAELSAAESRHWRAAEAAKAVDIAAASRAIEAEWTEKLATARREAAEVQETALAAARGVGGCASASSPAHSARRSRMSSCLRSPW